MSKTINDIVYKGESYKFSDIEARNRLDNVEYQTVVTEEAYLHTDLPEGEKTITINGDGSWGDTAYVSCGEDLIPRKTFNRSFPWNGITINKVEHMYRVTGATTDTSSVIYFGYTQNDIKIPVGHLVGKTLRILTFADQILGSKMSANIQFFDSDMNVVKVSVNGTLRNNAPCYVASSTKSGTVACIVPENATYIQAAISVAANQEVDCYIQMYVVVDEDTHTVTLDEPIANITNVDVTNIFSFPYQSTTATKAPIAEYIDYMADNAKGDTATFLTPEAFGAVGDGYSDDINAINTCLVTAANTKQTVIMAKKYLISTPIEINSDGYNVYINDVIYNGTDAAVKIHSRQNTIKIHSITSSGIGIKFLGDGTRNTTHNNLEVNTITSASHGIVFQSSPVNIYQNTVRFDNIVAGGDGCYGIAAFKTNDTFITENNFYGGQITNCDWAVYCIGGNSKVYGVQIEHNVKGGFYIDDGVQIFAPRWAESSRDGEFAYLKFVGEKDYYTRIIGDTLFYMNEIDLTEHPDVATNDTNGNTIPVFEGRCAVLDMPICSRHPSIGVNTEVPNIYTRRAYVWGKYLIMTPYMAYRKVVETETLDTRLIGRTEETDDEIQALSQLPTKFVVNTINSDIYLHESYSAFGFNEFEVEQANGFTCKVYDKLENLIFDGTDKGDGVYKFKVYKDAEKSKQYGAGLLRRDFLGHYWEVTKETTVNDVLNALPTWSGGAY